MLQRSLTARVSLEWRFDCMLENLQAILAAGDEKQLSHTHGRETRQIV